LLISPLMERYPDYFIESTKERTNFSLPGQKGLLYEK